MKLFEPSSDYYVTDYPGHNRWDLPWPIVRVTGGEGGEALLIIGSKKTALYDCGMACFYDRLISNIKQVLTLNGRDRLDYVLLSHTHYDHIGALPYLLEEWPEIITCGSKKAKQVCGSDRAKATIEDLGENAKRLYRPELNINVKTDSLKVDKDLYDGEELSLGDESIIAYETKGHTDCCMSFLLEPVKVLFTSESTGVFDSPGNIRAVVLKSFEDAVQSCEKLGLLDVETIIVPHFGSIPKSENKSYFSKAKQAVFHEKDLIESGIKKGYSKDEILKKHEQRFWKPELAKIHPFEAYHLNAKISVELLMKQYGIL